MVLCNKYAKDDTHNSSSIYLYIPYNVSSIQRHHSEYIIHLLELIDDYSIESLHFQLELYARNDHNKLEYLPPE